MTSERVMFTRHSTMGIKVLYLPKNFYTSPKQISGYAPDTTDNAYTAGGCAHWHGPAIVRTAVTRGRLAEVALSEHFLVVIVMKAVCQTAY